MNTILGASMLGYGFNILGSYDFSSKTFSILTPVSGTSNTYTDPYSKNTFAVPDNTSVTRGSGDQTQSASFIVAQDQNAFQSELAVKAGISGSYRGFSGEFNFAFGNQAQSQSMYWYSMGTGTFESWIVALQEASSQQFDSVFADDPDVQAMQNQTSFTQQNQDIFFQVFEKWGTHFIDTVVVGGTFFYYVSVDESFSSDETTINTDLNLEYKALFVDAQAQSSVDWSTLGQQWSSDRTASWSAAGGDASLLEALSPDPTYGNNYSTAFQGWVGSIANAPATIGFHLTPISDLFSGSLVQAITDALTAYTNQGVYVSAEADVTGQEIWTGTGLIMLSGTTIDNPATAPAGALGGAQLAVFDGVSLEPLVDVGAYWPAYSVTQSAVWAPLALAVQGLTQQSYIVALTAFGLSDISGFPPPDFVTWMQGCGASLSAWKNDFGAYCGDEFAVSYTLVGQQGLEPGDAVEKFNTNVVAPGDPEPTGNFTADASPALVPAIGGGPFTLATPTQAAIADAQKRKRTAMYVPKARA